MKTISMEDVISISLAAIESINNNLKEFNIVLDEKQEDEIYVYLLATIEKLSQYPDYRHHN